MTYQRNTSAISLKLHRPIAATPATAHSCLYVGSIITVYFGCCDGRRLAHEAENSSSTKCLQSVLQNCGQKDGRQGSHEHCGGQIGYTLDVQPQYCKGLSKSTRPATATCSQWVPQWQGRSSTGDISKRNSRSCAEGVNREA